MNPAHMHRPHAPAEAGTPTPGAAGVPPLGGLFRLAAALAALASSVIAAQDDHAGDWPRRLLDASQVVQAAADREKAALEAWDELERQFPVPSDWMQQDYSAHAWRWFLEGDPPSVVSGMVDRVLKELGPTANDVQAAQGSADESASLEQYLRACEERRSARLRPLLGQAPRIVFTKHYNMGGSHYAYTEGQSDAQAERHFVPGSALCLLEMTGSHGRVTTLLADPTGVIRDPDVSFDGRRVLFAWKKSELQDDYHLYELDLDTRAVRQLTDGLGVADYEGAYLPDGDIIFNSTRCVQTVDCFWTEVSNLYRCNGDGRLWRRLAFDQVHDNFPTVTEDGRILYTRWEYNDRGQVFPQPLLQMNPDGTGQAGFYGVNSWFPTSILHARQVPGTQKVLAIASGHHSMQTGKLILLDPAKGREENQGVQLLAPVRETRAERIDAYGQQGDLFQYPYPLTESEFLVTYHPLGWEVTGKGACRPRFGVYYMTADGRRELLASDPELPCNQPIPVRPRIATVRPVRADYRDREGECYVQDVYAGPGLAGVPRGTIKTLRVVAIEYRAAGIGHNNSGGPGGGALSSTPVSIGNGCWDPKVILGDADVQEDGSAFFRVPARRPVYFQLLDAEGRMVQTMRSWTSLQAGEKASCVGCHETKNASPAYAAGGATQALRAGPRELRPFYGAAHGFSFAAEIQPILDAKCVSCHDGSTNAPPALRGVEVIDPLAKRKWSEAYLALTHARPDEKQGRWRGDPDHAAVNWVSAQSVPTLLPPNSAGSIRSGLVRMLTEGHGKVSLSREEMDKLCAWIDLGVPFCGDYTEAHAWSEAEERLYQRYLEKRIALAAEEEKNIRCLMEGSP
jgi:malonyl CoA-acyl carrier protein transacylase